MLITKENLDQGSRALAQVVAVAVPTLPRLGSRVRIPSSAPGSSAPGVYAGRPNWSGVVLGVGLSFAEDGVQ